MFDYYEIDSKDFQSNSKINFNFVPDYPSLCYAVAKELATLIRRKSAIGEMATVILPVGPIDYGIVADYMNKEKLSCKSLVVFAMDEYINSDGLPLPANHPLSFRSFLYNQLVNNLDRPLRIPEDQIILPTPEIMDQIPGVIQSYGGIDITFGGLGVNGHFAFNSPLDHPIDIETFKNTSVRVVNLREGDVTQFALYGTNGNLETIPTKACTLGMRELLSARKIFLTFMRNWHAGALRRALFGPITPTFPGSLIQLHQNVYATITPEAAAMPCHDLLMGIKGLSPRVEEIP